MTDLEKKLNKIYNYADLIHTENNFIRENGDDTHD